MLIYITGCPTRFLGSVKMKMKLMKCENVTKRYYTRYYFYGMTTDHGGMTF